MCIFAYARGNCARLECVLIAVLLQLTQSYYSDWMLFALVGVIVGVEIVIVLVGTAVPQSRLNATLVPDLEHPPFVDVS